ncbi:MAG: hypothetical protein R2759_14795 [Bacteroidales bacterium]
MELPADLDSKLGPDDVFSDFFDPGTEKIHLTAGGGLQLVFDQNTVINFEYGRAFDQRDGNGGLYIGIGFLF